MSCCDGWFIPDEEVNGECPECGGGVVISYEPTGNIIYEAQEGCGWSPTECDTCGWSPCDGSC